MVRTIVQTVKHFVHTPVTTVATGVRVATTIATGVVAPATTLASDVQEGSIVEAVYIEWWASATTVDKTGSFCLLRLPAGAANPSAAEMNNLGAYINKRNILKTHQGLLPSTGNLVPVFREWVKIPKGKQRFGLGDSFRLISNSVGGTMSVCGIFVYKEKR